jgi:hypothetical protein
MSKAGYEAIPDVEKGDLNKPPLSPREVYPEASPQEAELLGVLDSCIDGPRPELSFTKVSPEDVTTSSPSLCCALVLPLLVTIGLCVGATFIAKGATDGIVHPSLTDEWFPYVAAAILWLAASISISNRLVGQASYAIGSVAIATTTVDDSIDSGVKSVTDSIAEVQSKLDGVVGTMKKKLAKATKNKKSLKKVDPSIAIPDPSDVEKELDGARDEIQVGAAKVKEACNADKLIPGYLKSTTSYWWSVVSPVLLLCLVLQVAWTYVFTVYLEDMVPTPSVIVTASRHLIESEKVDDIEEKVEEYAAEAEEYGEEALEVSDEWLIETWAYSMVVFSSFFLTFFEIAMVYAFTTSASVASMANGATESVSESTNRVAREVGFRATIESVLGDKMGTIKQKLLKVIGAIHRIEEASAKISKTAQAVKPAADKPAPKIVKKESLLGRMFSKKS